MSKAFVAAALLIAVSVLMTARPSSAASNQYYFQGTWRCQNGETLRVTPSFGPWVTYTTHSGSRQAQYFMSKDPVGGGWANTGVDNVGGFWTMTSSGWQGQTLTFTGTYIYAGQHQSQRQVFTQNANNAMTVQIWRNGSMVGQAGCNK